jgi:hypothetical protein
VDRDFFHLCLCSSASSPPASNRRHGTVTLRHMRRPPISSVSAVVSGRRRPARISDSRGSVRTNAGSLQLAPSVANVSPMTAYLETLRCRFEPKPAPRRNAARMHPFPTGKPRLPQQNGGQFNGLSRRIGGGRQAEGYFCTGW